MDISYNKVDKTALPISQDRVSASEYNQIAASLMHIINSAGLTPDSADNAQLLTALGPRIVETYSNGTSWYRVYSDGWCEQGGQLSGGSTQQTLTFLKTFADTDYTWLCSTTSSDNYVKSVQATSFTTTGCTWKVATDGGTLSSSGFRWEAKGYLQYES